MEKWTIDQNYFISTDKDLLKIDIIFQFLNKQSYWAHNIPKETVIKSIQHSALCFGVYKKEESTIQQVGFARVVSDLASFAYLCDVFVLPEYRGIGLSKQLMQFITTHPELQQVRRFMLATKDAHQLYAQYGFKLIDTPENLLQIRRNPKDIYSK
ncbi:GNAT family N-acetyltransferase [Bacillus massiliigorillae]|uniref:GNAT family N-acetyltransferase n=1 Tax=Bacillus massiliigorillae TaxID=1243664 RepID=UPI0003A7DE5D|nr:GNAT family N-acetyltransferase [Bacillus massiliigorillae]